MEGPPKDSIFNVERRPEVTKEDEEDAMVEMDREMQEDQFQLCTMLPEGVWRMILQEIKQPRGYQQMLASSPYLQKLEETRRVQQLFIHALPVIFGRSVEGGPAGDPVLSLNDVLHLRKVSRILREGVDTALQQHPHCQLFQREQLERQYPYILKRFLEYGVVFPEVDGYNEFNNFLSIFEETDNAFVKPFFCRRISIYTVFVFGRHYVDLYTEAVQKMLKIFGDDIWQCSIFLRRFADAENLRAFYYVLLPRLLKLTPNVRICEIKQSLPEQLELALPGDYPTLPCLTLLRVCDVPYEPLGALIKANPQIRTVDHMSRNDISCHESLDVYVTWMSKLIELSITLSHKNEMEVFERGLQKWLLQKLHLAVPYLPVSWDEIFEALGMCASLQEMWIWLPHRGPSSSETALRLPGLKKLGLKIHFPAPLRFILSLGNHLVELGLESCNGPGWALDQYDGWRNPAKSNVWEFLPKLKLLKTRSNTGNQKWHSCNWHQREAYLRSEME